MDTPAPFFLAPSTGGQAIIPFQQLLDAAPEPVLVLTGTGRIAYLNAAAGATFGVQEGEELPNSPGRMLTGSAVASETLPTWQVDQRLYTVAEAPLQAADGNALTLLLFRDITGQTLNLQRLRQANHDLQEFVHTLGHEIRLPLTPVMGYAQYICEDFHGYLATEVRDAAEGILSQARRTLSLLDSLQHLGQTGYAERPQQPVATDEVLQRAVSDLQPLFDRYRTSVSLAPLPRVRIPEDMLYVAFTNLLRNAAQHAGSSAPIEVGGECFGEQVHFFVRDHGQGVSQEEGSHIFHPHQRGVDASGEGSGMGLAIVTWVTGQYGGRSWVEETNGGGATFWISFSNPPAPYSPLI